MNRPVLFLVNERKTFAPKQSTAALAQGMAARHPDVVLCGINGLAVDPDGKVRAQGWKVAPDRVTDEAVRVEVGGCAVWVRLNPGRAKARWQSSYALECLTIAERRGAKVHNRPSGLWEAMSKLSLMNLPARTRPRTFVSPDPERVASWVRDRRGASVVKPALGTHGEGVQKVTGDQPDLMDRLTDLAERGPIVAQAYLGRAHEGDVRVHLVDGEPLVVDGKRAIVRRTPPEGDFRSNVSAGGKAVPAVWDSELAATVQRCGPALRRMGLFHVGLDVVAGKVVEINAFSPGGLSDAGEFMGADFVAAMLDAFEAKVG